MKRIKHRVLLAFLCMTGILALAAGSSALAALYPGPDEFGYIGTDAPFNLRDVSTSGTALVLQDDQVSAAVPLPFAFNFYGINYTEVFVSSNGFITFTTGTDNGCCSGRAFPAADDYDNIIAGFWEDLNPSRGGDIRYETIGTSGNREFVIGFYEVPHYPNTFPVTFEIILHENGSAIELQYGSAPSNGGQHSVGIENADGTIGLQVALGDVSFNGQGFFIRTSAFAEFAIKHAEIKFENYTTADRFKANGTFTLDSNSNGIDPLTEKVLVIFGTSTISIPPGAFLMDYDHYKFKGDIDGALVAVTIKEAGPGRYRFDIKASGVDLSGTANPITIGLSVGADYGLAAVLMKGKLEFRSDHDRHQRHKKK